MHDTKPRHIDFNANKVVVESKCESAGTTEELGEDMLIIKLVGILREKAKIKLSVSTIKSFVKEFGEDNTKKAVNITINRAIDKKKKKLTAPKQYMSTVLTNMVSVKEDTNNQVVVDTDIEVITQGQGNYTSNNSKRFKGQPDICRSEEEYNEMEKQLIGWYAN